MNDNRRRRSENAWVDRPALALRGNLGVVVAVIFVLSPTTDRNATAQPQMQVTYASPDVSETGTQIRYLKGSQDPPDARSDGGGPPMLGKPKSLDQRYHRLPSPGVTKLPRVEQGVGGFTPYGESAQPALQETESNVVAEHAQTIDNPYLGKPIPKISLGAVKPSSHEESIEDDTSVMSPPHTQPLDTGIPLQLFPPANTAKVAPEIPLLQIPLSRGDESETLRLSPENAEKIEPTIPTIPAPRLQPAPQPWEVAQAPAEILTPAPSLPVPNTAHPIPAANAFGQELGQLPPTTITPQVPLGDSTLLDPKSGRSTDSGHCSDVSFHLPNSCANAAFDSRAFIANPDYSFLPYNPDEQLEIYDGKWCVPAQAPWVETFRGLYRPGPLPPAPTIPTGVTNPIIPHFLVFGDYRTAIAINDNGTGDVGVWAHRLNLDFDLKITSTERLHAFWGPLDNGNRFTRAEFRDDDIELIQEFDNDFDTLFFEGDLGYIWGGMTDQWAPFDLPFVFGKYPLLFQNGIWMVDAIEGFAFTIPGKHSRLLDWPNFEATFFFGFDDIDSPAFRGDDNVADVYGTNWFIEATDGYWEAGYAFLEDRTGQGLSYHNMTLAFTRRYFHRVSNSVRVIVNAGQDPHVGEQTADGQLVLLENSLITSNPSNFVPYLNMFAGFDRPQSVARAVGGVLLNTGINFETDGLTGFPTLDDTANDTWGGALGFNLLGPDFSWQLVTEFAMVQTFGNGGQRRAVDDQYGFGARFQVPINNAWIVRLDGMYGIFENDNDISGARAELRWKF